MVEMELAMEEYNLWQSDRQWTSIKNHQRTYKNYTRIIKEVDKSREKRRPKHGKIINSKSLVSEHEDCIEKLRQQPKVNEEQWPKNRE